MCSRGRTPWLGSFPADRIERCPQPLDRFEGLAPVLVVLAPGALDVGDEVAVGVGMGVAHPVEPGRCVVGSSERDQPKDELHDPCRVALDELWSELVQPQPNGLHCDVGVGALRHAHRANDGRPDHLARAVDVTRRHRVPQGPGDVAALLQHAARPLVGRREPRSPPTPPVDSAGRRRTGGGTDTSQPAAPTGTTNRFAVSTRSSSAPDSSLPVTAKHSSASNASSTEVSTRNSATIGCEGWTGPRSEGSR